MEPDKNYNPEPVDTSDVKLPDELNGLTEELAKNVHDNWAKASIAEGWRYGEKKDAGMKTTPDLVPYEDLPDSEKDYDRNTALETLKFIYKKGYYVRNSKDATDEVLRELSSRMDDEKAEAKPFRIRCAVYIVLIISIIALLLLGIVAMTEMKSTTLYVGEAILLCMVIAAVVAVCALYFNLENSTLNANMKARAEETAFNRKHIQALRERYFKYYDKHLESISGKRK
ncbi:MAG: RyR domain-containing protein [Candidatus Cryptobacteroides sp.]